MWENASGIEKYQGHFFCVVTWKALKHRQYVYCLYGGIPI